MKFRKILTLKWIDLETLGQLMASICLSCANLFQLQCSQIIPVPPWWYWYVCESSRTSLWSAGDSFGEQIFWTSHFILQIWVIQYTKNTTSLLNSPFYHHQKLCNTVSRNILGWNAPETRADGNRKSWLLQPAAGSCSICMLIWDRPPPSPLGATGGNRTVVGKRLIKPSRGSSAPCWRAGDDQRHRDQEEMKCAASPSAPDAFQRFYFFFIFDYAKKLNGTLDTIPSPVAAHQKLQVSSIGEMYFFSNGLPVATRWRSG